MQAAPTEAAGRSLPYARLLRAARAARGWSQTRLMEASGLTKMDVYRFEAGRNAPGARAALALVEALEIPPGIMRAALEGEDGPVDGYLTELAASAGAAAGTQAAASARRQPRAERRQRSRRGGDPPPPT